MFFAYAAVFQDSALLFLRHEASTEVRRHLEGIEVMSYDRFFEEPKAVFCWPFSHLSPAFGAIPSGLHTPIIEDSARNSPLRVSSQGLGQEMPSRLKDQKVFLEPSSSSLALMSLVPLEHSSLAPCIDAIYCIL